MNYSTPPFDYNGTASRSVNLDYGRLALMLLDFLLASIACVANLLLLLTICKDPHRNLRSPSTNLVVNMTVADFMVGSLSGYLITAYDGLLFIGKTRKSLENLIAAYVAIAVASIIVACCNVVAMACDRWLAVCAAVNYRTIVTAKRVNSLIVVFWIYAIGFTSLSFYPAMPLDIYYLFSCHLHVSLPLVILPLVYWKTFRALEAHSRRMANLGPGRNERRRMSSKTVHGEKKITKAFVIVLCLFYVAFVPYVVATNLSYFCPVCAVSKGFQVFFHIAFRFIILNCSLDPFVYAWRVPKYRRAVWTVINRCCRCRRRNNSIDPEITGISLGGTNLVRETTNAMETKSN